MNIKNGAQAAQSPVLGTPHFPGSVGAAHIHLYSSGVTETLIDAFGEALSQCVCTLDAVHAYPGWEELFLNAGEFIPE